MRPLCIWTFNVTVSTLAPDVAPTIWPGAPTGVKAYSITVLLEDSGILMGGRLPPPPFGGGDQMRPGGGKDSVRRMRPASVAS